MEANRDKILDMKKLLNYEITTEYENWSVEKFLKSEGYSRHLIVHLRNTENGITVDGKLAYTTHRLSSGEMLTIRLVETERSETIVPVPMELDIVYEDEDLLVINKAANLPIHPSQGHHDCTLANGVADYYARKGEPFVYRAVNRLDRDTTGLLILAKHALSAAILSRMVAEREIHRQYLAVVSGRLEGNGTITAPIARVEGSTIERCVDFEQGDAACTHYQALVYNRELDCTLVSLWLETGRTHQIRVHMKFIGHPLPGDFLYCSDYRYIKRQALHSFCLEFRHPITKKELRFEAPLPDDMKLLIENIAVPLNSDLRL